MKKKIFTVKNIVLSGLFIALGLIMPFITMQIPEFGNMLLPMHLPVLICGFVCGWPFGLIVGFITPLLRSLIFTMPPMFPTAISMAFELAAYGFMTGFLYKKLPKKVIFIYVSLIASMILGRIIWGLASMILLGIKGNTFTFTMFLTNAFINAVPGIIVQIILIPIIILTLEKAKLIHKDKR